MFFFFSWQNLGHPTPVPAPMEGTYFLARSIEIEEELWGETLLDNPVEIS